jgi:hypothetical protein
MKNDQRVHACLDGELPREDLSTAELRVLEEMERALDSVAAVARAAEPPDLRMEVMLRLPENAAPVASAVRPFEALENAWRWFWSPRQIAFQIRPSFALAGLLLLLLAPLSLIGTAEGEMEFAAAEADVRPILVQFRLDAAEATSVSLAGTFSGWESTIELRESAPGVWTAMVPLSHGVHDYLFLIDGAEWVPDPVAHRVEDDFGGSNSRLFLTIPSSMS